LRSRVKTHCSFILDNHATHIYLGHAVA
jgi:hypothetical protein